MNTVPDAMRWMARASVLLATMMGTGLSASEASRSALPDAFPAAELLWEREFGDHQYTVPVVDRDRLYVGTNDSSLEHPVVTSTGGGILLCLNRSTGEVNWQLPIPRYQEGTQAPYHFNHWRCGVCSSPAVDGDRLYVVGPRGDVLCLDAQGQANGNDGPFTEEARYMGVPSEVDYQPSPQDGDILWRFDMIREVGVVPHDVCGSSPVLHGDFLYVGTTNGVDHTHAKVANPSAPSVIVLHKETGKLVATDGTTIGDRTMHGQWSSPRVLHLPQQTLILYGGGDGVLYALEPWTDDTVVEDGPTPQLKIAWRYDCCPGDYRQREGEPIPYARWNQKSEDGPSEIIATPVIDDQGRIYVAIGQSPLHGPGQGMLSCLDGATGRKVWDSRQVDRTLSNAVVQDGLLYISDYSGRLFCFDAATGDVIWEQKLDSGVWCASPVIADGKLYVSTEKKMLWVMKAGRKKEIVTRSRLRSEAITPTVADQVLYLPTQKRLFAVQLH